MILSLIAGISELLGLIFIGNKNRFGFIFNAICNILWIIVGIKNNIYGLLIVCIPAFGININNYIKWRKNERK